MSEIPGDLKFLKSHEWARIESNGRVTVGISDHAQGLLGDLVYVELPGVGDTVQVGNGAAVVESVKAASDVYSPVSGTVVEVNSALSDKPETINEDAYGEGWIFVSRSTTRNNSTTCWTRTTMRSCSKTTSTDPVSLPPASDGRSQSGHFFWRAGASEARSRCDNATPSAVRSGTGVRRSVCRRRCRCSHVDAAARTSMR